MELKYNCLEQIFKGMPMNIHTTRAFRILMQFCEDAPRIEAYAEEIMEERKKCYPEQNAIGEFHFRGKTYTVFNNDDFQCYEILTDKDLYIQAEPWNHINPEIAFVTQLLDLEINEKGENHVF